MSTRRGPGTYVLSTRSAMLKFMLVLLGSCLLSHALVPTATVQAQRREMSLSLRDATAFALQGNLSIQIAGLNPPIREAQVTESQGIFDLNTRASLRASDSRILDPVPGFLDRVDNKPVPGKTPQGLVSEDNSQEHRLALGLSQLIPYGGTYELELSETHLATPRRTTGSELKAV